LDPDFYAVARIKATNSGIIDLICVLLWGGVGESSVPSCPGLFLFHKCSFKRTIDYLKTHSPTLQISYKSKEKSRRKTKCLSHLGSSKSGSSSRTIWETMD